MRSAEIEVIKTFLCTLDASLPCANFNEVFYDEEDAMYGYIAKLCAAALSDTSAKTAVYGEDDALEQIAPAGPEGLEAMVSTVADTMYELVRDNATLHSGSAIFAYFMAEEQAYAAMFKMPFLEMYTCRVDAQGAVSWVLNSNVMPKPTLKGCEYFVIDPSNRTARVADVEYYIDDCKVNYIAEHVLCLPMNVSEKKTVEVMREAAVEVIRACYPKEQINEKIMDYRREVAEHVEATGSVSVPSVEKAVFSDSEEAGNRYRERMEKEQIRREPIAVSPKTERALTKKTRIVTDNGIELLVPANYLRNPDYVEYVQADDGKITILLKEIHAIEV